MTCYHRLASCKTLVSTNEIAYNLIPMCTFKKTTHVLKVHNFITFFPMKSNGGEFCTKRVAFHKIYNFLSSCSFI